MKLIDQVHPDKLRGGFYTEPHVVDFCLNRVKSLQGGWSGDWLEPSCGDGAFIRGLARAIPRKQQKSVRMTAVELIESEAAKSELELNETNLSGEVTARSFFEWARDEPGEFDVVVGNPPFVRYQFVQERDRRDAELLVADLGIALRRVSNLWIPFALIALSRVRIGGCFALVLPSELFCTASGGQFRRYLLSLFTDLSIDLFPRGTFPGILQDVVVLSGRRAVRAAEARPVQFNEHRREAEIKWQHRVLVDEGPWLKYLLTEKEYDAYTAACSLDGFYQLGELARLEVAIVTGANQFFTINDETAHEYELWDWAIPLLARTADSPGIIFTTEDHNVARERGSRAWLLDFSEGRPTPNGHGRVSQYLAYGESQGLPDRYKCRIRDPWYRVPHIRRGNLMMTKRAHHYHRLLLNQAEAYTTDTIYRGGMRELFQGRAEDVVATFQNTLTLLSSEIEGRTYGGGVLELVPSEVARLTVPLTDTNGLLKQADRVSRSVNGQRDPSHAVMQLTDDFLSRQNKTYAELLPVLNTARKRLQAKRQELTD
ncbi:MAG: N-6 DNA methylase [Planctomycetota bacterium]